MNRSFPGASVDPVDAYPQQKRLSSRLRLMSGAWLFLAAYACSGLAGLIYEVSWTRLATLYLGHTTAAASTVVAAFMGGLAGGSAIGGGIAARIRPKQALLAYAALEGVVILIALALPWELKALTPLLKSSYATEIPGLLFASVRLMSCLLLFTIPSLAIGATFPMAVRWFVTRDASDWPVGRRHSMPRTPSAPPSARSRLVSCCCRRLAYSIPCSSGSLRACSRQSWRSALWSRHHSEEPRMLRRRNQNRHRTTRTAAQEQATRQRAQSSARDTTRSSRATAGEWRLAAILLALSGFATLTYEIAWTRVSRSRPVRRRTPLRERSPS